MNFNNYASRIAAATLGAALALGVAGCSSTAAEGPEAPKAADPAVEPVIDSEGGWLAGRFDKTPRTDPCR